MSSRRGGALELGIARAARWYRRNGRPLVLVRQVDFIGVLASRALACEAKEARGPSLPTSRLREPQRELMRVLHEAGADVRLVVCFREPGEVYSLPWAALAGFLASPWRASWSLTWCRAFGELLPVENAGKPDERVLLLDGAPHPDQAAAVAEVEEQAQKAAVAAEATPMFAAEASARKQIGNSAGGRAKSGGKSPPDSKIKEAHRAAAQAAKATGAGADVAEQARRGPTITAPSIASLTPDERRARILAAAQAGVDRQLKRPRRSFKRIGGR